MKSSITFLSLVFSVSLIAQTGIQLDCPDPQTVACIEAIPVAQVEQLFILTDCNLDYDGNLIDTSTSAGGAGSSCDTAYIACYSAFAKTVSTLENGEILVEIEIVYGTQEGCKHAVSHVAFSLPEGVKATDFSSNDTYTGALGNYLVENTTNNPYYSIKFESSGDGFVPGTSEIFAYTLPAGVSYEEVDILVKAATNRDAMTLSLVCEEGPSTTTDTIINYEAFWIFDYIQPGGTGCIGDPIIVSRNFAASDACQNSSICVQDFYVESECVGGLPVGCGSDSSSNNLSRTLLSSSKIWRPESARYAVTFDGYEEQEEGYYSITKIWQPMQSAIDNEDHEIGRMAPLNLNAYSFAHESIEATDSIRVEWVGQSSASTVSGTALSKTARAQLFPNPGSENFTVQFSKPLQTSATVVVYDHLGRQQTQLSIEPGTSSLQLTSERWLSGIYRIQVFDQTGALYQATWLKQ